MGACHRQISAVNERARPAVCIDIFYRTLNLICYVFMRATLFKSGTSGRGAERAVLAGLQPRRKAIRFHNTYRQTDWPARPLLLRAPDYPRSPIF